MPYGDIIMKSEDKDTKKVIENMTGNQIEKMRQKISNVN